MSLTELEDELEKAREAWLLANEAAVNEAQTCLTKKGNFNPPLEKPWPKYEELRKVADSTWYSYYNAVLKRNKYLNDMNEKIKQLAAQAGAPRADYPYVTVVLTTEELRKFAELIVKECISAVTADYKDRSTTEAVLSIERHFGVSNDY